MRASLGIGRLLHKISCNSLEFQVSAMPDSNHYDVIVIGAGAAGLLAASGSAERGRKTLLIEKNRKPGVKILMSGGTRCNITHDCDAAGIIAAFGSSGSFLHSPLAAFSPEDLLDMLYEEGVPSKVEPGGKVFPQSDRAADVLNALLRRLQRSEAQLALAEPVKLISRNLPLPPGEGRREGEPPTDIAVSRDRRTTTAFHIETPHRTLHCEKLIVTTGGQSYPGCGTTGDGYRWLSNFGHTIHRPRPALVPLTTDEGWIHDLAGITIADVQVRVIEVASADSLPSQNKRSRLRSTLPPGVLIERRGSLLFTHFGLSGPAVLDVSRAVTAATSARDVALNIDFLPGNTKDEIERQLRNAAATDGKRLIATVIADHLPRRLADALSQLAGIPPDRRAAELSSIERTHLIAQLKQCAIRITGTRGFEKAEVTAGGVALDEVDSRTMQSKLVPGLYLAGEILDLDGFIGGYNFQAAFSTGYLAGQSA